MLVALACWALAHAADEPGARYGALMGVDLQGARLGFRIETPVAPERVRVHWDLSVATSGGWVERPVIWVDQVGEGTMLMQPLLGFGAEFRFAGPFFVAGATRTDVLAPVRGARALSQWDTIFPAVFDVLFVWPVLSGYYASTLGQTKLSVGVRPAERIGVEAGIWPSNALLWGAVFQPGSLEGLDWRAALRPGLQLTWVH